MSPNKIQNKFFIRHTSVAMVTRRRTIDRAYIALFVKCLAISENNFLILTTGPHDKQNYTLHTICLDDTS